jgi:hypothetical protein
MGGDVPNGDVPDAEESNVCSVLREIPDWKVVSVAIDRVNAGARHCCIPCKYFFPPAIARITRYTYCKRISRRPQGQSQSL